MQFSFARIVYEHGRGDRIRTCDILLPKQARYQAAPLPDALKKYTALSSGESCEFALGELPCATQTPETAEGPASLLGTPGLQRACGVYAGSYSFVSDSSSIAPLKSPLMRTDVEMIGMTAGMTMNMNVIDIDIAVLTWAATQAARMYHDHR